MDEFFDRKRDISSLLRYISVCYNRYLSDDSYFVLNLLKRNHHVIFAKFFIVLVIVYILKLHRIHKTLLDLVEDHYAEGEEDNHEDEAVDEPAPSDEFTGSEETVLEGLDDGSNRVEAH